MSEISAYDERFTFKNIFYKIQTPTTISYFYHRSMTMKNSDFRKKWEEESRKGKILIRYDRSDGTHVRILKDGTEVLSLQELCK